MAEENAAADQALPLVEGGFVSVAQAMALSTLGKSELYARMGDGSIRYAQYGRRRLIVRNSLLAFLASKLASVE